MAINFQHAAAIDNNVRLALDTAMNNILAGVRQELEANGGTVLVSRLNEEPAEVVVKDVFFNSTTGEINYLTRERGHMRIYSYYDLAAALKDDSADEE
jgi:hypothetical protein